MLPPFIIEQIRQREERERRRNAPQQPYLELPVPPAYPGERRNEEEDADRGVVIIDLLGR